MHFEENGIFLKCGDLSREIQTILGFYDLLSSPDLL